MKTNIKNFPRNVDVRGLLRLIWEDLRRISGSVSDAGQEVPDEQDDDFVGIPVATGISKTLYIKSTELSDFVASNTGVHVYADEECTTPCGSEYEGGWDIYVDGLNDYYAAQGVEVAELPDASGFSVQNGVITDYFVEAGGEEEE